MLGGGSVKRIALVAGEASGDYLGARLIRALQARLNNLYRGGKRRKAVNESIRDTFRDIGNYSIIAQMCEDGKWPLT